MLPVRDKYLLSCDGVCAIREYLDGANAVLVEFAWIGHGTGKMIDVYGSDQQKKLFLKKLYTGEWGGTMLLTEPQAGSDLPK